MSARLNISACILITVLSVSGCAMIEKPATQPAPVAPPHAAAKSESVTTRQLLTSFHKDGAPNVGQLFGYYRLATTASEKDLMEEFQSTKTDLAKNHTLDAQWRMALLLSIPGTTFYDSRRASTLFKELTNRDGDEASELNNTAFLIYSLLNEQHHLDRKLSSLTNELNESKTTNKKLQEQLDALKAIENTLYQRNKAEDTPKP